MKVLKSRDTHTQIQRKISKQSNLNSEHQICFLKLELDRLLCHCWTLWMFSSKSFDDSTKKLLDSEKFVNCL